MAPAVFAQVHFLFCRAQKNLGSSLKNDDRSNAFGPTWGAMCFTVLATCREYGRRVGLLGPQALSSQTKQAFLPISSGKGQNSFIPPGCALFFPSLIDVTPPLLFFFSSFSHGFPRPPTQLQTSTLFFSCTPTRRRSHSIQEWAALETGPAGLWCAVPVREGQVAAGGAEADEAGVGWVDAGLLCGVRVRVRPAVRSGHGGDDPGAREQPRPGHAVLRAAIRPHDLRALLRRLHRGQGPP